MSSYHPSTLQGQNSKTFTPPPLTADGGLVLSIPQTWDFHLTNSPNHPAFVYDDVGGPKRILWPQAVRAFHRAAHLVRNYVHVNPPSTTQPVIGVLASADTFTYLALMAGIIRAGYTAFPISTRNSPDAVAHLLSKTSCSHLFVSSDSAMTNLGHSSIAKLAHDTPRHVVHVHQIPVFDELFHDDKNTELLPPIDDPNWDNIVLILHSSGSTSFPKPISFSNRRMLQWGLNPYYGEWDLCGHVISCHSLPVFHALCAIQLSHISTSGIAISSFAPATPPRIATPDSVLTAAILTESTILSCVPTFLEIWSRDASLLPLLKRFDIVAFGGASLQQEVGDLLVSHGVHISSLYGATEAGAISHGYVKTVDLSTWPYFKFSTLIKPILLPTDEHNIYELVVADAPFNTPCVFDTEINGERAFMTKDLLIRHPVFPDRWKIVGRVDDQIIHSTGEKTNPGPLESILTQDPRIKSALMFGRGEFQAGVLVDLQPEYKFDTKDTDKLSELRNAIWPIVEKANNFAPQHSRLFKEMILFSDETLPFEYTGKGTPRRQAIISKYANEIRAAYDAVEESALTGVVPPLSWDFTDSLIFIRTIVEKVMEQQVTDEDDLFQHGCDSLQATWIRNAVLHALRQTSNINTRVIPPAFVYNHPSIAALSQYVTDIAASKSPVSEDTRRTEKLKQMEDIVAEFTATFPVHTPQVFDGDQSEETILVTGTTGGFGAHVLGELLSLPTVARVFALNRPSSSGLSLRERHVKVLKPRGVDLNVLDSDKLVMLEGDISAARFGLSQDVFDDMRNSVTTIMHIAWTVNFNNTLPSFRPDIQNLRKLIDFALSSPLKKPPTIEFTSSIGVFQNWPKDQPTREIANPNAIYSVGGGYGESKWVAERTLQIATEKTPLSAVVVRVGQLAGGKHGAWNTREWFPAMVKSATIVHCLPNAQTEVSWIPADIAARAFVDMRLSSSAYFHLVHPRPVPWSTVIQPLAARLGADLVTYAEWLTKLEDAAKADGGKSSIKAVTTNPALHLIEFFQTANGRGGADAVPQEAMSLVSLQTTEALKASSALDVTHLAQLNDGDVDAWLRYWEEAGFIQVAHK